MEQLYRSFTAQVMPDEALLARTKAAMRQALTDRAAKKVRPIYRYATLAAACFIFLLIAVSVFPHLNRMVLPTASLTADDSSEGNFHVGSVLPEMPPEPVAGTDGDGNFGGLGGESETDVDVKQAPGTHRDLLASELYGTAPFSAILPQFILPGYRFESAYLYADHDDGNGDGASPSSLLVTYSAGYDYVTMRVKPLTAADKGRIVSVADAQQYDIANYAVPLAESVPPALYETMHDPIFKAEELNAQAIALRKLERNESGADNAKYGMRFGILCGDLVIEYSIKGSHLDSVFRMVTSSDYFAGLS